MFVRSSCCGIMAVVLLIACSWGCKKPASTEDSQWRLENATRRLDKNLQHPERFGLDVHDRLIVDVCSPAYRNGHDKLPAVARGDIRTLPLWGFTRNLNRGNYLVYVQWMQHDTGPRRIALKDAQGALVEFPAQVEPSPDASYLVASMAYLATRPPYDGGPGRSSGTSLVRLSRAIDRSTLQVAILEPGGSPTPESWMSVAIGDWPPDQVPAMFREGGSTAPSTGPATAPGVK
jgi:hypothetical protein